MSASNLKALRQTLKACADDTRLRILNILYKNELTVKDICTVIGARQSTVSKHLSRLRLSKIVTDRRAGNLVYYSLSDDTGGLQGRITSFIVSRLGGIAEFSSDRKTLHRLGKH
jgi:DNA-binding transcriptional ArsR family regulator